MHIISTLIQTFKIKMDDIYEWYIADQIVKEIRFVELLYPESSFIAYLSKGMAKEIDNEILSELSKMR